jgi:hypothetical protein
MMIKMFSLMDDFLPKPTTQTIEMKAGDRE